MAVGPGKYDQYAQEIIEKTGAEVVAVIVLKHGGACGFAVKTTHPSLTLMLPGLLRDVADGIEAEVAQDVKQIRKEMGEHPA